MIDFKNPLFVIRIGLAVVFLWIGIDTLLHPIVWLAWVPQWLLNIIPFSPTMFMYIHGSIEALLGLMLLVGFLTRKVSAVAAVMLAAIIVILGFNDLAARDFAILTIAVALSLVKEHPLSLDSYLARN